MKSDRLDDFLETITYAYHRLSTLSHRIHADLELTTGMRAVLLLLAKGPTLTLSEIAEARGVSRQFIQKITRPMIDQGFVALQVNPRHPRWSKMALTDKGRTIVDLVRQREALLASRITAKMDLSDLAAVQDFIDALCLAVDDELRDC